MLAVVETHPIQYHAPLYRLLQQRLDVPVTAIYGSDFSLAGYVDKEFGTQFAWDTDLLSGYGTQFLGRAASAPTADDVSTKGLRQVLQKLQPTAILIVGYSPAFHQQSIFEAWRLRIPIIFRGETTDCAVRRGGFRSRLRDILLRQFYRRCIRLLYVGRNSQDHFTRLGYPREKTVFSPYCVDTAPFNCDEPARSRLRPFSRHQLGISDSAIVLLFSGKISFRKGPDLLLAAAKALPESLRAQLVLLFVGDGDLREQLSVEAQHPPRVHARFVGFKNQKELSSFYHAADLLVLPSRFGETWGLVVNEALHHGLPAVVSDQVGCAPDLVHSEATGEIFKTDSIEALSAVLIQALGLTNRVESRDACRTRVAGYSVQRAAEGIARAYNEVVASFEETSCRSHSSTVS